MKLLARLACVSACILAFNSQATTIMYKSLDDIVKESDGIVQGTVKQVTAKQSGDGDVYTYVTVGNIDALNGYVDGSDLTLRLYGGETEQEGLLVHGSPEFQVNEQVIVFVQGNGKHMVPISGWGQGVFRIQQEPGASNAFVTDSAGNRIFGIDDADIVKESRFADDINIVGKPALSAQSDASDAEGGMDEKGDAASRVDRPTADPFAKQEPMAAGEFVAQIRERVQRLKANGRELVSVESAPALASQSDSANKANNDRVFSPAFDNGKPVLPQGDAPEQDNGLQ